MLTSKPQKFWLNWQTLLGKKPCYDLNKFVSCLLTFEKLKKFIFCRRADAIKFAFNNLLGLEHVQFLCI